MRSLSLYIYLPSSRIRSFSRIESYYYYQIAIIIDRLLIIEKRKGRLVPISKNRIVQVSMLRDKQMMSQKGVIKYILGLWRKPRKKQRLEKIIIFYFNNLIILFEEKPRVFLSYINLNRWIEVGKKRRLKIILKH